MIIEITREKMPKGTEDGEPVKTIELWDVHDIRGAVLEGDQSHLRYPHGGVLKFTGDEITVRVLLQGDWTECDSPEDVYNIATRHIKARVQEKSS